MTAPTSGGIDVRARVAAFHEEHYSANLMRLAVYGREVRTRGGSFAPPRAARTRGAQL
jgi:hypothetical protein